MGYFYVCDMVRRDKCCGEEARVSALFGKTLADLVLHFCRIHSISIDRIENDSASLAKISEAGFAVGKLAQARAL